MTSSSLEPIVIRSHSSGDRQLDYLKWRKDEQSPSIFVMVKPAFAQKRQFSINWSSQPSFCKKNWVGFSMKLGPCFYVLLQKSYALHYKWFAHHNGGSLISLLGLLKIITSGFYCGYPSNVSKNKSLLNGMENKWHHRPIIYSIVYITAGNTTSTV